MRVTEKGQVTIPKPIREKLGIGPGSEVAFLDRGDFVEVAAGDPPSDPAARERWYAEKFARMKGTIDTMGMDGKAYVDWLRGARDDLDRS